MPTGECFQGSQPAACRTHDGTPWFPTLRGLGSVNPATLSPNTTPPPVVIESVLIDGRPLGAEALRVPSPGEVIVPADKESLELHFTCLNLSAPDKRQFRYRLEAYENSWTPGEADRRYARYS